jgi:tetratricopeptide (TPR) repeat protein
MITIRVLIVISILSVLTQRSNCAESTPAASPALGSPASQASLFATKPAAAPDDEKPSPELLKKYREAAIEMEKKNYDGALAKVDEAVKMAPANPNMENLRGAIYTQQKNYAKATEAFTRASQMDKKAFSPRYNLCEILFLQKKYSDALAQFQVLQAEDPKNDLVKYKVFLCYLVQDHPPEARKLLDKMDPFDELPVYYFSKAAWDFKNSNPTQANTWLVSARNIYPPQKNALFVDSLMELGYIPRDNPDTPIK